jgi:hypothetical protein
LLAEQGYSMMDLGADTLVYLQPKDADFSARMSPAKVVRV